MSFYEADKGVLRTFGATNPNGAHVFDVGVASDFLTMLDPDTERFLFFSGDDDKARAKADRKNRRDGQRTTGPGSDHRLGAIGDTRIQSWIVERQSREASICVTINAMKGARRKLDELAYYRGVWCENDDGFPADGFPIEPSYVAETSPGHFHSYFLLDPNSEKLTDDEFEGIMRTMVSAFGCDPGAKDASRALRLPGTVNNKPNRERFRVTCVAQSGALYSKAELLEAFPPPPRFERAAGGRPTFSGRFTRGLDAFVEPLKHIPADDYATWIEVKLALHHESGGSSAGLQLFKAWSATSEKYSEAECDYEWRISKPRKISGGKIMYLAEQHGYTRATRQVRPQGAARASASEDQGSSGQGEPDWPETTRGGVPRPRSILNVATFLEHQGVSFSRNVFTYQNFANFRGEMRPVNDDLLRGLRMEAERLKFAVPREFFEDVCLDAAARSSFNPLTDYIDALVWDGKPRLKTWLIDYLSAENTPLNSAIGTKHLIAAVRRARHPGAKHDAILVLESPQGFGKSTAIRVLAGDDFFTDALTIGADAKQTIECTSGVWLAEIAELGGLRKSEAELVKAMISRQADRARLSYERHTSDRPRQFVLFGSVNDDHYLKDHTGNRRFWTVKVGRANLEALRRDRDQIWAEAACLEARGEPNELPESLWSDAAREQAARVPRHRWSEILEDRLDALCKSGDDVLTGTVSKDTVWAMLDLKTHVNDGQIGQEIGRLMKALGWRGSRKRRNGCLAYCFTNQPEEEKSTRWLDLGSQVGTDSERYSERWSSH